MLEYRHAEPSDAALLARLVRKSFREQAVTLGLNREEHPNYMAYIGAKRFRREMAQGRCFVLGCLDGEPIGCVAYRMQDEEEHLGHIGRLSVLPEHRGRGYGADLGLFAEARLSELGATAIEIAMVARFRGLRTYYESLGYQVVRRRRAKTLPFTIYFMRRRLADPLWDSESRYARSSA